MGRGAEEETWGNRWTEKTIDEVIPNMLGILIPSHLTKNPSSHWKPYERTRCCNWLGIHLGAVDGSILVIRRDHANTMTVKKKKRSSPSPIDLQIFNFISTKSMHLNRSTSFSLCLS